MFLDERGMADETQGRNVAGAPVPTYLLIHYLHKHLQPCPWNPCSRASRDSPVKPASPAAHPSPAEARSTSLRSSRGSQPRGKQKTWSTGELWPLSRAAHRDTGREHLAGIAPHCELTGGGWARCASCRCHLLESPTDGCPFSVCPGQDS